MEPLAQLAARIRALEDVAEIKRLKYRYLAACDAKDPETLRDCLLPIGAVIAYEGFPHFTDRDSFVAVFQQMACRPNIIDMHHGANPQITLTGDNTATGIWSLYFHSIDTAARTALQMGCVYNDAYVREAGRWWISHTATRRTSFLLQTIDDNGLPRVGVLGTPPDTPFGK